MKKGIRHTIAEPSQKMSYDERERLKRFAWGCNDAEVQGRVLVRVLVMIAHWMRQRKMVPFEQYASNWMIADTAGKGNDNTAFLSIFPHNGERRIEDGCSDWDSFGNPGYMEHRRNKTNEKRNRS